jgi:hypothetical protein
MSRERAVSIEREMTRHERLASVAHTWVALERAILPVNSRKTCVTRSRCDWRCRKVRFMSSLPLLAEPPQHTNTAPGAVASLPRMSLLQLPCSIRDLSDIQRYILARVAVHSWTHGGSIPFVPPNAHQATVAARLAAPEMRLLIATSSRPRSYRLSRLGQCAVRQVLHLVPAQRDRAREIEFDRLRTFMEHAWETGD